MNSPQNLMAAENVFREFLASNGHPLEKEINYDASRFHYLKCPHGSSTDARYKFYSDSIPSGYFKCWHCDVEADFCSKQKNRFSSQEWQMHRQRIEEDKAQAEIEAQKRYAEAAALARAVFFNASETDAGQHGYLRVKRVKNYGLRIITTEDEYTHLAQCYKGTLLVPCFDADDNLVNLERIYLDSKDNKYKKRPLCGGQRNGAYYLIGEVKHNQDVILLAEGVATGFTAHEASGYPVAISFNCNNLLNMAHILRKKYPETKLLIIADDDKWHSDINLRDTGEKAAKKVCSSVNNASYFLPDFDVLKQSEEQLKEYCPTDLNDLFVHLLLNEVETKDALTIVQKQIFIANSKAKTISHSVILDRLLEKVTKLDFNQLAELRDGEKLTKNHMQVIVINQILILAKNNNWGLCKQFDFLYLYNGEYWSLLEEDELKTFLGNAAEKMGLRSINVQHFNFKEHLYKQFLATANLPKPENPKEVININLKNGTFEIAPTSNNLKPFNRKDFMTYQLPFEYNPQAGSPLFFAYLNRVLPEQELQDILAEYLSYVFVRTSTLKLEKTMLLYGSGANGKSVFYEIVRSLLGEQNTSEYSLQSLTNENGYYRAMIVNKLVNYASEINGKLESSIFKQLVSGEPVEARLPHGRPFTLTDYAKFIFNCNELPKDVEQNEAYFRRFIIIPFEVTIPESEQDKQLPQKIIKHELSGVFNWVLQGLARLLKQQRFTESKKVALARAQYEKESDSVMLFLEEANYISNIDNFVFIKELYPEYKRYCQDNGYFPVNSINFKKRLIKSKIMVLKKTKGEVAFLTKEDVYSQAKFAS